MRRTVTNEKGEYQFQVAPGVYQATAALRGFESAKTAKVLLEENQTLRMETTLSVSPPGQWIPLERQ
jgi:protocatechuate 3,4-dioxygenase beta subunit